jgi:hypothetical protein
VALQGVAGRHHPPKLVEPEPPQRRYGAHRMPFVRRVERAAHQPDPLTGEGKRHLSPKVGEALLN